jgi:hypothetical protein
VVNEHLYISEQDTWMWSDGISFIYLNRILGCGATELASSNALLLQGIHHKNYTMPNNVNVVIYVLYQFGNDMVYFVYFYNMHN